MKGYRVAAMKKTTPAETAWGLLMIYINGRLDQPAWVHLVSWRENSTWSRPMQPQCFDCSADSPDYQETGFDWCDGVVSLY